MKKKEQKSSTGPVSRRMGMRQRRDSHSGNTQRYLPFSEIRNDTVILKNGGLRAVLKVEPLNFNLKSETEQQGIIAGYESFINTLVFPVQILIRSTKVNIEPYLNHIHEHSSRQESKLLKEQTQAYAHFIERIVEVAEIMQKNFYVILPLDETPRRVNALDQFLGWIRHTDDSLAKVMHRSKLLKGQLPRLKERIDLVQTGLRNIGIPSERLGTLELIQLYYDIYNHEIAATQKLPKNGEFNTAPNML
jgi:type IV secretory pathway VirB4 component